MNKDNQKILIVQLSDPEKEPEKCIAGLIFARTLCIMENEVFIFSMARSPLLYTKDLYKNKNIERRFRELIKENLEDILNAAAGIYICSKSKELLQLEDEMLVRPFQIAGMIVLYSLSTSADQTYYF